MKNIFQHSLLLRLLAVLLALTAPALSGCEKEDTTQKEAESRVAQSKIDDDLLIRDYLTRHNITEGTGIGQFKRLNGTEDDGLFLVKLSDGPSGANIINGNRTDVRYVGRYLRTTNETTVFDNSTENATPCGCFSVLVGAGQVVKGWDQGLLSMKEGDRYLLLIPSYLAYGSGINPTTAQQTFAAYEPILFDMTILDVR